MQGFPRQRVRGSCDIIEPSGGHPDWHIHGDALEALKGGVIITMDGVTHIVDPGEILAGGFSVGASANYAVDENGKILAWNDPQTAKIRSKTFPGIAKAMAEQWGGICVDQQ